MTPKWPAAVLVFGAASGLIVWREVKRTQRTAAASPAPASARLVLYADLSEVDEAEGCGAIIRGVREATRRGVATEEIDARKPSDRLARYKLLPRAGTGWRGKGLTAAFLAGLLLSVVIGSCGTPVLASLSYAAYKGNLSFSAALLFQCSAALRLRPG